MHVLWEYDDMPGVYPCRGDRLALNTTMVGGEEVFDRKTVEDRNLREQHDKVVFRE